MTADVLRAEVVPVSVEPVAIPGAKPRNVVFVLSDDHRFDAMSFLGHQLAETPYMDAIAARGVHLKNAFVPRRSAHRAGPRS